MSSTSRAAKGLKSGRSSGQLSSRLRAEIASGRIGAGEYLPTERELAARHGVAGMTARRALKALELEGLISAEPRRGYRVLARANDPSRGAPLAYVLAPHTRPDLWDELHQAFLAGFQQAAAARGWTLLAVGCEGQNYEQTVAKLRASRVCGAILDTPGRELIDAVQRAGLPAITVDDWREDLEIDSVVQDGFRGGLLAGKWLTARGHRRVGWLGPVGASRQGLERFGGASAALTAAGAVMPAELRVELADPDSPDALAAARQMLARRDRPEAVLALWQGCTAAVAAAARELGLTPGRDFDMVGWSTEEEYERRFLPLFAGLPVPPAVTWRVAELTRTAIARLAELRTESAQSSLVIKVPTRLKVPDGN